MNSRMQRLTEGAQDQKRRLIEAKKTYKQAQAEILDYLKSQDWAVKPHLKIPQAISPDKQIVLWFKKQAVWGHTFDGGWGQTPDFKAARSLHIPDLRKLDGAAFVADVKKWFKK
jgi:hypothetical protein